MSGSMRTSGLRFTTLGVAAVMSIGLTARVHAQEVEPVNNLPNPYETVRNWGMLPDGRAWGSVPAADIDADGNIYAAEVGTGNPIVGITKYVRRFDLSR
jgi:hypothetical protein